MTRRIGSVVIIEPEPPGECELCSAVAELRPYGPKGERICHPCGLKDPAAVKRGMRLHMFGEPSA